MLAPGATFSSGRLLTTGGAAPTVAFINQGVGFLADSSVALDTNAPSGNLYRAGIRQNAAGAFYATTTLTGTDVWVGGLRTSLLGQLVVEAAAATSVLNGNPLTANGVLAVSNVAGAGAWGTTFTGVTGTNQNITSLTVRSVIPVASLAAGSKIRFSFKGGTGTGATITQAAVGLQAGAGDDYDFASTPVAVTFATGSASAVIAPSATVISDDITLTIPAATKIVLATYITGGGTVAGNTGAAGWLSRFLAANDVTTVNATGYSNLTADLSYGISLIEVFSP